MRRSLLTLFVLFGLSSGDGVGECKEGEDCELPEGKMFGGQMFGPPHGFRGQQGFNRFGPQQFGGQGHPQQFGGHQKFRGQGHPHGGHHGGRPQGQFGGHHGSQFGGHPQGQFGGHHGSQFGGRPQEPQFGEHPRPGAETGGPLGGGPKVDPQTNFMAKPPQVDPQFGGPQVDPHFGGPQVDSHFGGPHVDSHHFGGPHFGGGQHRPPPGSQLPPWLNEIEDEMFEEADHVHVDLNLVVHNIISFLRPVLTQAIKTELANQGISVLPHGSHPFPGGPPQFPGGPPQFPGGPHQFPGGPHQFPGGPPSWMMEDDHEDLDEFLGGGPPGQFGGGPYGPYGQDYQDPSMFRSAPGEEGASEDDSEAGADSAPSSCLVTDGPNAGKACILPFGHNGKQYTTCALEDEEGPASPWCSTKVDASGKHVSGEGEYGSCDPENAACKP